MVDNYVILTDSTSDLPKSIVDRFNIPIIPMDLIIDDKIIADSDICLNEFYNYLKESEKMPVTARINPHRFIDFFSKFLEMGKDIIYVCFSSGLSGSYESAVVASKEVAGTFPERKIEIIDSLCASIGEGLFVYELIKKKESGYGFEELVIWANNNKLKVNHWFMIDDLKHLKRGGRISNAVAVLGGLLSIKPILWLDSFGKLDVKYKARGRQKAEEYMVSKILENAGSLRDKTVIIGYTDNKLIVEELSEIIKLRFSPKEVFVSNIGAVIGSHVGPGMFAVTFFGYER